MILLSRHWKTPLYRWASLRTELIWAWDSPIRSEPENFQKLPRDHRVGYWAGLVKKGNYRVEMDGQILQAHAGQWLVIPQGMACVRHSNDAWVLAVQFHCQWPTGENLFAGVQGHVWEGKEFSQLEHSATALSQVVRQYCPTGETGLPTERTDYQVFLRVEQLLRQWLIDFYEAMLNSGRILSQGGECDGRIWRVAQCLHESPIDAPFPVEKLTHLSGLGRAHLDRLFFKEFRATTREYWEHLRQNSAKRSLEASSQSIKEIGYRHGFKQASHFTKWFTQRVGTTPKLYRDGSLVLRRWA